MMRIHILGICGTFMGGIAAIARQAGFEVTGADANAYPPMSDELEALGIRLHRGYDAGQLDDRPDLIVVGNVMKRGMPVIERMLNEGLPYVSGPQWLEEHYLKGRKVMAVSGTHGKTTTSSMLAWILESAGLNPGFLIGGMPGNFSVSARSTGSPWFVIEADEYDCAFFDKRSKFVHYHPRVLAINNIEYDHADIFANVGEIERQFHHLVRTVPSEGLIAAPAHDRNVDDALAMGCWTPVVRIDEGGDLSGRPLSPDCSRFEVFEKGSRACEVSFACTGEYSMHNALTAMACARYAGVSLEDSAKALSSFRLPKRRMELKGTAAGVEVYDDFAHHPTAVKVTLHGLREKAGPKCRIIAVFEPRSNSMKMGANAEALPGSFADADEAFIYAPAAVKWNADAMASSRIRVHHDLDELVSAVAAACAPGTKVLAMSNGSFGGFHKKLLEALSARK
jgi:UDP-N-acetylmuramate: L-alanyl-gamma-D-glutamyl-meso-diaminopimelate ligase